MAWDDLALVFSEVRTARLVLRRPDAGDGPTVFRVHGDPATNLHHPAARDPDLAASEERLREWLRVWERDGYGYWTVTLPPDGEVIGFGGVRTMDWPGREALNLYYRFQPGAWGQGYAAETARTAVELARTYLPHLPILARTRPANVASQRTAQRAGLARRPDLDTAEHVVFALGWPAPGPPEHAAL